jgi:hypothetical protein
LEQEMMKLPSELVKKRLLPRFLSFPFFTEPSSIYFMRYFLTQKNESKQSGLLTEEEYKLLIIPFIQTCFSSKNRSLRMKLLQTLEYFISYFPEFYLEKYMAEMILEGIYDLNDDLVMHSMDGLVILSKYLKSKNGLSMINSKILPSLHHFVISNEMPISLRSHSLSCLFKLWSLSNVILKTI